MINGTAVEECAKSSETEYFWYRETLDAATSMDDNGGFKWWIVICLMVAWIIVFFIVMKGIQSSGKVREIIRIYVLKQKLNSILCRPSTLRRSFRTSS